MKLSPSIRHYHLLARHDSANEKHKRIVEEGGGIYVTGMLGHLVLFNSPATHSTLGLPEHLLTPQAVRAHIAESDKKFGMGAQ